MTDNSVSHVAPESRLKLMVTGTAPGFGDIDPDSVTEEPTAIELGDAAKVMPVGGLVKVVKVVDVLVLVDVCVQTVTVVVVVVIDVEVDVELVVVKNVEVVEVVVVVADVVADVRVPWIMTLVV